MNNSVTCDQSLTDTVYVLFKVNWKRTLFSEPVLWHDKDKCISSLSPGQHFVCSSLIPIRNSIYKTSVLHNSSGCTVAVPPTAGLLGSPSSTHVCTYNCPYLNPLHTLTYLLGSPSSTHVCAYCPYLHPLHTLICMYAYCLCLIT